MPKDQQEKPSTSMQGASAQQSTSQQSTSKQEESGRPDLDRLREGSRIIPGVTKNVRDLREWTR
ncbi:hypothetical protein [Wolbachia endosymbiont of Pentidionis agamae]|uniref:hypothetical protein n=1 Tax=Wolbachia endosymbiont of Pentidionis agamae TaxID=3110435 RepID=UPI002FD3C602